jgi:hypothetical protein
MGLKLIIIGFSANEMSIICSFFIHYLVFKTIYNGIC